MTHSHDSFAWLAGDEIPNMTHAYLWHDSFVCVTWLVRMRDMTHANDSPMISCLCTRVIWLIHICEKPMTHDSFTWLLCMTPPHDSFIRWDDITHTFWFSAGFVRNAASLLNHLHMCVCCYVLFTWHDPLIRATRAFLMCAVTHPYVSHHCWTVCWATFWISRLWFRKKNKPCLVCLRELLWNNFASTCIMIVRTSDTGILFVFREE